MTFTMHDRVYPMSQKCSHRADARSNRKRETTIATWSLNRRLRESHRREELIEDMKDQKVGVAVLQATGRRVV